MKYLCVFLLVSLIGLVSCGDDATGNASENVKPKLKEYSMDEVVLPNYNIDIAYVKKDMKPVSGIVKDEYENGQTKFEWIYKDGKLNGLKRRWYSDGQLKFETYYKDGKPDGLKRRWSINGRLNTEWNYKDGKKDGLERRWYNNGKLQSEKIYQDNFLISEKCFDEDGNLIKCD